jgi:lysozyme family protein
MVRSFGPALAFTLAREGGFVNNANDPGGATNLGITRQTLSRWLKRSASVADVKALTTGVASSIYHDWYWCPITGDALPAGVDLMIFDMGVNAGCHEAAVELQQVLGFQGDDVDGDIGPMTLGATDRANAQDLIAKLSTAQEARYRSLPGFADFGDGWLARVKLRTAAALKLTN